MTSVSVDKQHGSFQPPTSMKKIVLLASIGTGIQFGWALQFSLLTPYIQLLGIPHKWTSFIWLCGPVSGMLIQPFMGYHSDKCRSRWGRRRPFIAGGAFLILIAIFLISFAVDFGRLFGDPLDLSKIKHRAIVIFVSGFWALDVGNNTIQGPCRAFLADLAGKNQQRMRIAYALFTFFLAVGNVLGFAAGSITHLYKFIPITKTAACNVDCANLKTCFFIDSLLLLTLTTITLILVQDKPLVGSTNGLPAVDEETSKSIDIPKRGNENVGAIHNPEKNTTNEEVENVPMQSMGELVKAMRELPRSMWLLLLVTCLNYLAWTPFLLYDTDWMGKEIYGGEVGKGKNYGMGVREGALGLMLNSVVLGCMALGMDFFTRKMGGAKRLWGCVNLLLALCMGFTVVIAKLAESSRSGLGGHETHIPPLGIRASALALFMVLGIPLAVTLTIPVALASIFSNSSGTGQGLTIGVLNIAVCIPQILVALASGPWDALFGGGNLPAFVVGAVAAAASVVALTMLPSPTPDFPKSEVMGTNISPSS